MNSKLISLLEKNIQNAVENAQVKTSGISEFSFEYGNTQFFVRAEGYKVSIRTRRLPQN